MAVQVFQKNPDGTFRSEWIEPDHLQNHLDAGWSVDDPHAPKAPGLRILNPKPVESVAVFPNEPVNVPADVELLEPTLPESIQTDDPLPGATDLDEQPVNVPKKRGRKPKQAAA